MDVMSTIIVSVYNDTIALELIMDSLLKQTSQTFDVIVSQDGDDRCISDCLKNIETSELNITHLTQQDIGFRKNIALNRAIGVAETDHLVFIDGDCILHPGFMRAHQCHAGEGIACTGRRLELGEKFSQGLREHRRSTHTLTNRFTYILNSIALSSDGAKNLESGLFSKTLQRLNHDKEIRLLGCNFSCDKRDLIKLNGFNQDYLSPGIGEDSDIDWRLVKAGVEIKNVKFSAIQYHLYHPRRYDVSDQNRELFEATKRSSSFVCNNGIERLDI